MRGANIVARVLADAGHRTLFAMSGNQLMPLFDAFIDTGPLLVHVRHEAAAVHMADAWARVTGQTGVAIVPAGPGFANALSALYTARQSDSAVLLISAQAPLERVGRGAFQEMDQAAIAEPFVKWSAMIDSPDAIAPGFQEALQIARDGRPGPVHLALPSDVLTATGGADSRTRSNECSTIEPDLKNLDGLMARLRAAARPLILAGPIFGQPGSGIDIDRAQCTTGVPIIVMESPRGTADPAAGALFDLLPAADLIILLGRRPDYGIGFGEPFADTARFIQIDAEREMIQLAERNLGARLDMAVAGEPRAILRSLADRFGPPHGASGWRERVGRAAAYRPASWRAATSDDDGIEPATLCNGLACLLDDHPEALVVIDGGEFGQWAQSGLSPALRIINGPAGAIGAGLPFGIATKLANPTSPVFVLMGDGTAGFHLAEFETAARCQTPIVVIIGNDARWNAEYQIQLRDYGAGRVVGCDLSPARYDVAARGLGCHGEHVERMVDLATAIERAMASGLPACINVRLNGQPAPVIRESGAEGLDGST